MQFVHLFAATGTAADSVRDAAVETIRDANGWLPDWVPAWGPRALRIAVILLVALLVQKVVRRLIRRTVRSLQGEQVQQRLSRLRGKTPKSLLDSGEFVTLRRAQRAETIGTLMRSVSGIIIFVVTALAVARQVDIPNLTAFVGAAGIATAALGFGAQNIVRDFLAGIFIVVEDQYGVGDVIDVGEASGLVESVSLRVTRIRAADGTLWHVPNGEIKAVGNQSQQWSRAVVEFRLDTGTDIPAAIKIIKREADEMWQDVAYAGVIIEEPEIWGPESIDALGILMKLIVKTKPLEQWQVSRSLRSRIKRAFDAEGIALSTAVPMSTTV